VHQFVHQWGAALFKSRQGMQQAKIYNIATQWVA